MSIALFLVALACVAVFPPPIDRLADVSARPRDGPKPESGRSPGGVAGTWVRTALRRARLAGAEEKRWEPHLIGIAADIDLFAACVAAGLSQATAATVVSQATGAELARRWRSVASLMAIGAEPGRCWQAMAAIPGLGELARIAQNSAASGSRIASSSARVSERLRGRVEDQKTAAGQRAGVLIAMPLTFCFLPAFFLLGLAPVVIGLAGEVFG
ncbi:hypothetical protein CATYP_01375 [Corynebacterium atypicum]|uniref:Type II secretion system protein GspF domain-containing protein n=1 Tax=Corynebacterium atypicum TaxID=191610 RepID=A0ABM5QLA9_9CORY|nr:type II secretion system F family protein [Corynebacterium atypicum]AIG63551.1 hypothetical protein CATYP_01375 [Corynebacterium atypicum]